MTEPKNLRLASPKRGDLIQPKHRWPGIFRLLPAFAFLSSSLYLPISAFSQTPTVVTGTVKDVNGLAYANARVTAQLIPSTASPTVIGSDGIPHQIGGLNAASADVNGNFTMNLFCNSAGGGCSPISPSGTQWQFTVTTNGQPPPLGSGPQSCSATLTITGESQSISASFAACPNLGIGPLAGIHSGPETFTFLDNICWVGSASAFTTIAQALANPACQSNVTIIPYSNVTHSVDSIISGAGVKIRCENGAVITMAVNSRFQMQEDSDGIEDCHFTGSGSGVVTLQLVTLPTRRR